MFLTALCLLMCLVQAQPVSEEPLAANGEVYTAEIEAVGAPEVKKAYAQQQLGVEQSEDSLSRQKRAICRCYRRPRNPRVICICR